MSPCTILDGTKSTPRSASSRGPAGQLELPTCPGAQKLGVVGLMSRGFDDRQSSEILVPCEKVQQKDRHFLDMSRLSITILWMSYCN